MLRRLSRLLFAPGVAGLLALGARPAVAQGVGEVAPPLTVEVLLNAPGGASAEWADLRGKVVVVEFWATWCAPCIASIPHLNDLAGQFRDEPIVFLSLTDEPRDKVEAFLKRRPIAGWVGLDTDSRAGPMYGVATIPRTFLVGRDGKVLGSTHPDALTADHLRRALRGGPLGLKVEAPGATVPAARGVPKYADSFKPGCLPVIGLAPDEAPEPLAQVIVRPALDPEGGSSSGGATNRRTWINIDAASLVRGAYGEAYGVSDGRVDLKAKVPDRKLDAAIWAPPTDPKAFRRLVELGIGGAFGLAARVEDRAVDVLYLRATPAARQRLTPTVSTGGSTSKTRKEAGRLISSNINGSMESLAGALEGQLELPVIDQTGLPGGYDYGLTLPTTADEAPAALEPLGLDLVKGRLNLPFVVVEPAGP